MTAAGAAELLTHCDSFRHLRRLDLTDNEIPEHLIRELGCIACVTSSHQRSPGIPAASAPQATQHSPHQPGAKMKAVKRGELRGRLAVLLAAAARGPVAILTPPNSVFPPPTEPIVELVGLPWTKSWS